MFSIRIRNLFYFSDSEKKTETLQHQQLRVVEITFQFIARLSHRRRVTVAYIHTYIHTPRSALGCDSMSVCLSVGLNEVIFVTMCSCADARMPAAGHNHSSRQVVDVKYTEHSPSRLHWHPIPIAFNWTYFMLYFFFLSLQWSLEWVNVL